MVRKGSLTKPTTRGHYKTVFHREGPPWLHLCIYLPVHLYLCDCLVSASVSIPPHLSVSVSLHHHICTLHHSIDCTWPANIHSVNTLLCEYTIL